MGRDWRLSGRGAVKHPAARRGSGEAGARVDPVEPDSGFVLDDQKVDHG